MEIVRFRVALDSEEVVFRDIDIALDEKFELLHHTVVEAFGMEEGQMSSFYESNEQWDKGLEIPLVDMGTADEPMANMSELGFKERNIEVGYRLLYVFDFLNLKIFYLEAIDMLEAEDGVDYPCITVRVGDNPVFKNSIAVDLTDEALLQGVEEFDPHSHEDDFDDGFDEGHENIDDLDGLI
jgi:hypothetical protein